MAPGHTVPGATTRTFIYKILKTKQLFECEVNNSRINTSTPRLRMDTIN